MIYSKRLFARLSFGVFLALIAIAVMIPVFVLAAGDVKIDSTAGVANVTAGDKTYSQAINAKYNEIIKLQVSYRNNEDASSNKTAEQVRLKIDISNAAGKAQTVKTNIKGYNTNAIDGQVAVNLDREDANLQYIPGSAVWKHNTATGNGGVKFSEEKISDEVVSGAQGMVLEDQKPGDNYAATVTVLARVMAPGVKVTKQVELSSESNKWTDSNNAKPGDTLKYLIGYQNTGSVTQNKVVVRDSLPAHLSIVPGTTSIINTTNPSGATISSDNIANGGVDIGSYAAGANAYITFQAKVDSVDKLACGNSALRDTAGVQPENVSEHFASAATMVTRDCAATPTPPAANPNPTPTPVPTPAPAAVYSCDLLTLIKGDNRKLTAKVDYTAKNGANFKSVTYNFGDGSTLLTTDKISADYTYKKDGNYTVTAILLFTVNGKDQTATSEACAKSVSFASAASPSPPASSTPTPTPVPSPGNGLPSTGPGDVIGIFVGATVIGTLIHRFVIRRFAR